jgi:hypothetical protein
MRKTEFMDLLKYYFRKSDKKDLKGIIEDCEEQFRIGAKEGKSEEEICCKLGSPKNIYRYYIGKPIIPEDNPKMPYEYDRYDDDYDDYDDGYAPYEDPADDRTHEFRRPPARQNPAYDWERDPERLRRKAQAEKYYRSPRHGGYDDEYEPRRRPDPREQRRRRPVHPYQYEPDKNEFKWDKDSNISASRMIVSPFLQILGTLFHIVSGLLFLLFAASIVGCFAITSMPLYLYSDLLPLPTITMKTMIFAILAILFAAMTAMYAADACLSGSHKKGGEH